MDLLRALKGLDDAYINHIEGSLSQSPAPNMEDAWKALDAAHGVLIQKALETHVVSRRFVRPLINPIMGINTHALTPFTRPSGVPEIATSRITAERTYYIALLAQLIVASRADLGLSTRSERKTLKKTTQEVLDWPDRSSIRGSTYSEVSSCVRRYEVHPLPGSDNEYRISAEMLTEYTAQLPALAAKSIDSVLIHDGDDVYAAVVESLPIARQLVRIRQIGLLIEVGIRGDHGNTFGYRDLPDGSRLYIWESISPLET